MSLSTMNKQAYQAHRASIRANGIRFVLPRIECPFEQEDMAFLMAQTGDQLAQRQSWASLGSRLAFMLTTPFKAA